MSTRWPKKTLGEICEIIAKQVDPTRSEYSGLPHISGENIESGTLQLLGVRTAAEDGMMSGKYLFERGDVLYSKLRPYLRKVAVAPFRGVCSADMYPLRAKDGESDPEYLAWLLLSEEFTDYANEESRRARMPKLNREQLFAWITSVPPLTDQRRIARRLREQMAEVARARAAVQAQLAEIERLPAALLRTAFSPAN
jgi:type I restriction enzyme S subunit